MQTQTATAAAAPVITLTREHRDAIWHHVNLEISLAGDLEYYVSDRDKAESREIVWRLHVCLRLLDQLGWHEHDRRATYQLEVDADTARFMEMIAGWVQGGLANARTLLCAEKCEDDLEEVREWIDEELDALGAARRVRDAVAA